MNSRIKILIAGAGEAGEMLLAEYKKRDIIHFITGFVDDDETKKGSYISGKLVIDTTDSIDSVIKQYSITEVIIAMPSAGPSKINGIISKVISADRKINIYVIPSVEKYFDTVPLSPSLHEIVLSDLFDRPEYSIDVKLIMKKYSGKSVLITGAGGSIGSEMCRQLLKFDLKKIIAVGRGENSIYQLAKSLNRYIDLMKNKPEIIYKIVDVKDSNLLDRVFMEYKPDVVFHAAAHKHVPLMEFNEIEAIQNNVTGAWNVLELSAKYNIGEFVLVSTDKAVHPVNVMGATKRLAELITGYFYKYKGLKTAIVRFGNVIGSRGSVIPLFREQIEKGGPVTVTHPDITRYFMSIPEAALLVINASAYSEGGELYVLDMGKQYKIIDIVERLIELYGYKPYEDIKIKYTGLRPGEKMFEELFYTKGNLTKTENEKIFLQKNDSIYLDREIIEKFIFEEIPKIIDYDPISIRKMIKRLVPGYSFEDVISEKTACKRLVN